MLGALIFEAPEIHEIFVELIHKFGCQGIWEFSRKADKFPLYKK